MIPKGCFSEEGAPRYKPERHKTNTFWATKWMKQKGLFHSWTQIGKHHFTTNLISYYITLHSYEVSHVWYLFFFSFFFNCAASVDSTNCMVVLKITPPFIHSVIHSFIPRNLWEFRVISKTAAATAASTVQRLIQVSWQCSSLSISLSHPFDFLSCCGSHTCTVHQ